MNLYNKTNSSLDPSRSRLLTLDVNSAKGELQVVISYDHTAVIHYLDIYCDFTEDLVRIDIDMYERQYPTRYAKLQGLVNDELGADYEQYK